jgi:DNA-binding transcriptional ArsR family regulator
MEKVFVALSDPNRRKTIELLYGADSTLLELAHHFPVSFQALSKHIKILNDANLMKEGKKQIPWSIFYWSRIPRNFTAKKLVFSFR